MGRRGSDGEWAGPTPMVWQLRIKRDILAVEDPLSSKGILARHWAPKPGTPVLVKEVPITSGYEKQ